MLGFAVASPGCKSKPSQLCAEQCDCAPCNDREQDECELAANAERKRASKYDCSSEYDTYIDCALSDNDCDDGAFTIDDSCGEDYTELAECIADNSDLAGSQQGPGPGPGPGPGAGGSGAGGTGAGGATFQTCDCMCDCADCGAGPMTIPWVVACDPSVQSCTCTDQCSAPCEACMGLLSATGTCM
jgi:hypothetical protein